MATSTENTIVLRPDAEAVGAAIGKLPSGCHILTVTSGGQSTGVLVSWVQQAAFVPPSVSVCIRSGRPVLALMEESRRFLLNVLGDNVTAMLRHFGRGFGDGEDAFAGIETEPTPFGPALPSCVAHLGCEISGSLPTGDHLLYVARVAAGYTSGGGPYVHIRKNGLSY